MTIMRKISVLTVAAVAVAALGLGGCGGGGSGGGAPNAPASGTSFVTAIRLINVPTPGGFATIELWNGNSGSATPNPPGNIPLNVAIEIEFSGSVNSLSLPQGGVALGAINITSTDGATATPAAGSFGVSDAPGGAPGNSRLVTFLPTAPTDPANPASTAGLGGNLSYTVFIPRTGNTSQVVSVGGSALQNEAVAAFLTCDPNAPAGPQACFTDPQPGPPHVVMTIPSSNDPAPSPVDPSTVLNNTVTAFISEPLFPLGIDLTNVRLINSNSGAQVPGSVQFFQAGTPEAGPDTSRIDYIASSQLLANVTYELVLDPAIADFGGNSVVSYDPNNPNAPPSGQRFFLTIPVIFCAQPPITDNFDTTANRDTVTGIAEWGGGGMITSTFPFSLTGDGTFGDMIFMPGQSSLDTGMPAQTGFADGNYNALNLDVQAGANVRAEGNFRPHIRCLGAASISGTINGNAGTNPTAPLGSVEQGAGSGAFNNGGNTANSIVRGGVGGVGGGAGGRGSQDGYTVRTEIAESGFGPPDMGMSNPGPFGSNALYGGGQGGDGDFRFPSGGAPGNQGGIGGAGGSAWQAGNDGQPYSSPAQGCLPTLPALQPISTATPAPAVFTAPIMILSAGSGGGGGGDRFEMAGPTSDDQGAGGGGGGGGLRISAVQALDVNAGAALTFNGAGGGTGNLFFAGGGGGGAGGEVWLQSFLSVNISTVAQLSVNPGTASNTCSDHASGAGGFGMYQFEDPSGMPNTNFQPTGGGTSGANIITVQFPFDSTNTGGTATSTFFDTGYGDPDFDPATVTEMTSLGMMPPAGASIIVEYQGAFEALSGGMPDLTTLSSWVSGPNLDSIDGFRYVRFRITMSIPTPNTAGTGTLPSNSLPTADLVSFGYLIPCNL